MKKSTSTPGFLSVWQKNSRALTVAMLSIFSVAVFSACEDDDDDPIVDTINQQDQNFTIAASQTINGQIALANLAKTKGVDDSVIEYANLIADEHAAAKAELAGLVDGKDLELSEEISEAIQTEIAMLSTLEGEDFDKKFIDGQLTINESIKSAMQNQLDNGQNTLLRTFSDKVFDIVEEHRRQAALVKAELALEDL